MMHSQTTLPDDKNIRNVLRHAYAGNAVKDVVPEDYVKKDGVSIGTERTRAMFNMWGKCGQCDKNGQHCPRWLMGAKTTPSTSTFPAGGHAGYWQSEKTCNGSQLTAGDAERVHTGSKEDTWDSVFWYSAKYETVAVEDIDAYIIKIFCKKAKNFKNAKVSYEKEMVEGVDYSTEMAKFDRLERLMRSVVPNFDRIQRLSKEQETTRAVTNKIAKDAKAAAHAHAKAADEDATNVLIERGRLLLEFASKHYAMSEATGTLPIPKRTLEVDEVDDESRPSKDKRMRLEFLLS